MSKQRKHKKVKDFSFGVFFKQYNSRKKFPIKQGNKYDPADLPKPTGILVWISKEVDIKTLNGITTGSARLVQGTYKKSKHGKLSK